MTSPLAKLRKWVIEKKEISYDQAKNEISADGEVIDLSQSSNYTTKKSTTPHLMEAIYEAFLYIDGKYTDYVLAQKTKGKTPLTFVVCREIYKYLKGEVDTIEGLAEEKEPEQVQSQPAQEQESTISQASQGTAESQSQSASQAEHVHQDYSQRQRAADEDETSRIHEKFMERKSRAVSSLEIEYELLRPIDSVLIGTTNFGDMLIKDQQLTKPKVTPDFPQGGSLIETSERRRYKNPIIIVPQTTECTINNSNVEKFLLENKWEEPKEVDREHFTINHMHTEKQKILVFDVITNTKSLTLEDWNQVVAVFLSGKKWQLKELNFEQPNKEPDAGRIFKTLNGIYVHFDNQQGQKDVEKWKIKQYEIKHAQRFTDAQVVSKIWHDIEETLSKMKK